MRKFTKYPSGYVKASTDGISGPVTFDVFIQQKHVHIGMEDVVTTYYADRTVEDVSMDQAEQIVRDAAAEFFNSEEYQRHLSNTTRSYYPSQYPTPSNAVIAIHGAVKEYNLRNYREISRWEDRNVAVSVSFDRKTWEAVESEIDKAFNKLSEMTSL